MRENIQKKNEFKKPEVPYTKKIELVHKKQAKEKENKRKRKQENWVLKKRLKQQDKQLTIIANMGKKLLKIFDEINTDSVKEKTKQGAEKQLTNIAGHQQTEQNNKEEIKKQYKEIDKKLERLEHELQSLIDEKDHKIKRQSMTQNSIDIKTPTTNAKDITAMVKLGSFQSNKTVASNSKLVKNKAASENSNEVETIKPH